MSRHYLRYINAAYMRPVALVRADLHMLGGLHRVNLRGCERVGALASTLVRASVDLSKAWPLLMAEAAFYADEPATG